MRWAWETYGEKVYAELPKLEKAILEWCEQNDIDLNTKKRKQLTSRATWEKQKDILDAATHLHRTIGEEEFSDYAIFSEKVDTTLKSGKFKLSATERNAFLSAVSWYDETAEKVVKKIQKFTPAKLDQLLTRLSCAVGQLPDFGDFPSGKPAEILALEKENEGLMEILNA